MPLLKDKPCENCGCVLKAVNPEKGANYYYPCACNRPVSTDSGVVYPGTHEHELILTSGSWNLNDLLTPQSQPVLQFNVENGFCQHLRTQGDNYGVTCIDCGKAIAGYGYWGEGSKTCLHCWTRMDKESTEELCMYCQRCRSATPLVGPHIWKKGDLGRVQSNLVLLLEIDRSIWVSQGGDCGYWPAAQVEFIRRTDLQYRFMNWKEAAVDYVAGKFTSCFNL